MSKYDESKKLMDRREFLRVAAAGGAAFAMTMNLQGCMAVGGAAKGASRLSLPLKYRDYNLVFVSFDALQAAHVHSLGYPRQVTPTIDAMARQGVSFANAVSVSSWTVPASMTWFTGVYPSEHRLLNKFAVYNPPVQKVTRLKELAPNIVTLAEVLKKNGYVTGGFTGDAGVSAVFGYGEGFDTYFDKVKFGDMEQSVPRALEWIASNRDRKFFVFLHGYDAHGQCVPQNGFDYRFVDKGYDRRFSGSKEEQEALREEGLAKGKVSLREEDVRFWRAIYDEKINRVDERFKLFMEGLDRMGLRDRTLFVLTSDHGTEFYEHQRFDHGFSLYDELIHVPLVITLPGRNLGRVVTDQVSSIDVMPTVLDLLDVAMPEEAKGQIRGASLVPALKGVGVAKDVFSETDYRLYTFKRSIRTKDGWKLICTMEDGTRELYNLNTDPQERVNLVEREPRVAYELEQRLFTHFRSIGHDLDGRRWETGLNPVYDSQAKGVSRK